MGKPKNLHAQPMDMNVGGGITGGKGVLGRGVQRGKNWNKFNSIMTKIYF